MPVPRSGALTYIDCPQRFGVGSVEPMKYLCQYQAHSVNSTCTVSELSGHEVEWWSPHLVYVLRVRGRNITYIEKVIIIHLHKAVVKPRLDNCSCMKVRNIIARITY